MNQAAYLPPSRHVRSSFQGEAGPCGRCNRTRRTQNPFRAAPEGARKGVLRAYKALSLEGGRFSGHLDEVGGFLIFRP